MGGSDSERGSAAAAGAPGKRKGRKAGREEGRGGENPTRASRLLPPTRSPSPSPRRVLFGSVRDALIASERHALEEHAGGGLEQEAAGAGYVVLRQRQRSQSVGAASTATSEAPEAPVADAAGYTVIRRRASSDASCPASRATAAPSSEPKRRPGRRNHRGGDKKERRARVAQRQHETRKPPGLAPTPAPASQAAWQRGGDDPLGSMSSLGRALRSPETKPRAEAAVDARNPSSGIAPPPGLGSASLSEWLAPPAEPGRSLWAPVSLPPPDPAAMGQHQPKEQEGEGDSAWAAATSAGVLSSRSVAAWPPPPPPMAIAEEEDKVASWLSEL